ncbi:TraB/GumN family protein [Erythrobacter sp. SDW2]|uniref:TraB/GumN family protein n=1 Tax=Erythrobacter sp. SDW2 TaxID=2907154 RepID=UPI001F28A08A|nr:TraB/GumN family protein [Erythrobacter sp. SDW2]UIP05828.1 TraB/GumN family protein [Erythrobacter sp. SDW2]
MIGRTFLAGAAALMLAACGEAPPPPPADNPLLWEIASADGQVEGWLFGTIHALPDGVVWQTGAVDDVINAADYLVLEVADLQDSSAIQQTFAGLARSPGLPSLEYRVDPAQRPVLAKLSDETPYSPEEFRQIETWAAALILANAIRTDADPTNGVDRALQRLFADRRIEEFEGAERQFAIFDALAESDQRAVLSAVLEEAGGTERSGSPAAIWLSGDIAALEAETARGMLADPEVADALLTRRNLAWIGQTVDLLEGPQRPLIAVGAAHLVGPEGLVALLQAQGFTVRRLR